MLPASGNSTYLWVDVSFALHLVTYNLSFIKIHFLCLIFCLDCFSCLFVFNLKTNSLSRTHTSSPVLVFVFRLMSASRKSSYKPWVTIMFSWSQRSWTLSGTCQKKTLLLPSSPESFRSLILRCENDLSVTWL